MANGNDNGNSSNGLNILAGLPAWVRTIFVLGAPTVAAGWLIYLMSAGVSAQLMGIHDDSAAHIAATQAMTTRFDEFRLQQETQMEVLIRVLQANCMNTAQDQASRNGCMIAAQGK